MSNEVVYEEYSNGDAEVTINTFIDIVLDNGISLHIDTASDFAYSSTGLEYRSKMKRRGKGLTFRLAFIGPLQDKPEKADLKKHL